MGFICRDDWQSHRSQKQEPEIPHVSHDPTASAINISSLLSGCHNVRNFMYGSERKWEESTVKCLKLLPGNCLEDLSETTNTHRSRKLVGIQNG